MEFLVAVAASSTPSVGFRATASSYSCLGWLHYFTSCFLILLVLASPAAASSIPFTP